MVGRMLLPLVLSVFVGHPCPSPTMLPEPNHSLCLTQPVHRHLFGASSMFDPTPHLTKLLRHHLFSPSPLGRHLRGILLRYIFTRFFVFLCLLSLLPSGLLCIFFPHCWTHTTTISLPSLTHLHLAPSPSPSLPAPPPSFAFPLRLTSSTSFLPLALNAHVTRSDFDPDFVATLLSRTPGADVVDIILDTSCTFSITTDKRDFVTYEPAPVGQVQTVNGPTALVGTGLVRWTLISEDGHQMDLLIPCHHVPDASSVRLLSPRTSANSTVSIALKINSGAIPTIFGCTPIISTLVSNVPSTHDPIYLSHSPKLLAIRGGALLLNALPSSLRLLLPAHPVNVQALSVSPSSTKPTRTSLLLRRIFYSGIFVSVTSVSRIFSI